MAGIKQFLEGLLGQVQLAKCEHDEAHRLYADITSAVAFEEAEEASLADPLQLGPKRYIYGEVDFSTIRTVLSKVSQIRPSSGKEVFYDLGSGCGKGVIAVALLSDFARCQGIEILPSLNSLSGRLRRECLRLVPGAESRLKFRQADLLSTDWSDGSVVFASMTCFAEKDIELILEQSRKLARDAVLVTLSKSLEPRSTLWRVRQQFVGQASWSKCTVFIHQKVD